jgi:Glutathione S-transferase, N-terminal domain
MKLYHFPSPNPQKIHFALLELGLECEIVPVDLTKGEQRKPDFLALNPYGRARYRVLDLRLRHSITAQLDVTERNISSGEQPLFRHLPIARHTLFAKSR